MSGKMKKEKKIVKYKIDKRYKKITKIKLASNFYLLRLFDPINVSPRISIAIHFL